MVTSEEVPAESNEYKTIPFNEGYLKATRFIY